MDYYELLEVHPKASQRAVDRAYRDLCRRYHPDVHPADKKAWAHEKMTEITEAYRILSDPELRREYEGRAVGQRPASQTPAAHRGVRPAAPGGTRTCARHPERPKVSACMICDAALCAECRTVVSTQVCCPTCASGPFVARREASHTIPQPGRQEVREPWLVRLVQGRFAIVTPWDLLLAASSLVVFTVSGALVWVNVGFRLWALSKPGAIPTQAAFGFVTGVVCGLALWIVFMSSRPSQRWVVTLCVLPIVFACGMVGQNGAFRTDHLLAARTAARQKHYQSAITSYAMAEWRGQFEDPSDAPKEIGIAYYELADMTEDDKLAAQAARGAIRYLREWVWQHPGDAHYDKELHFCFETAANYFDVKRGSTATWDEAIRLWQERQQAVPSNATPFYYCGLSEFGRFHCMQKRPSVFATRQLRRGINTFYDGSGLNEVLAEADAQIRVSELTPPEQHALSRAIDAFTKAWQCGSSVNDLPADYLFFWGEACCILGFGSQRADRAQLRRGKECLEGYKELDPHGPYVSTADTLVAKVKDTLRDESASSRG